MRTPGERLKWAMEQRNIKQAPLAEQAHVSQVLIHKILTGKVKDTTHWFAIGDVLDISAEWLQSGKGSPFRTIKEVPSKIQKIPLIDWQHIDQFLKIALKSGDYKNIPHEEIPLMLGIDDKLPEKSVMMIVRGDTMTPKEFQPLGLCDGDKVVIDYDPDRKPKSGDIVLFTSKKTHAYQLLQYMQQGTEFFFRPFNKEYEKVPFDEKRYQIMGVMVYIWRKK